MPTPTCNKVRDGGGMTIKARESRGWASDVSFDRVATSLAIGYTSGKGLCYYRPGNCKPHGIFVLLP